MSRNLYQEVTQRILTQLQNGTVPWVKPWSATAGNNIPCNAVSNRPYSGVNVLLLWNVIDAGYATPRFLTFKQALEAGGNVRKGEHGFKVVFVKQLIVRDKNAAANDQDATRTIPMLREYTVFNVAQCENLPDRIVNGPTTPKIRNKDERDQEADSFVDATSATILHGHGQAMFIPSKDIVCMPNFSDFHSADSYYCTMFHELSHWTGHKTRLDRDLKNRFGTQSYAAEELVAELSAAFLCAEFSIDNETQSAAYIANWIQLLKNDPRAFFTAASAAQKAADFLRGKALAESTEAPLAA